MIKHLFFALGILSVLSSCNTIHDTDLSAKWTLNSIDKEASKSNVSFEISGLPKENNWVLYFNHMLALIDEESIPTNIKFERIAGDFLKMYPTENFKLPEGSLSVPYKLSVVIQRKSDAPGGLYLTINNGEPIAIKDYSVTGINEKMMAPIGIPTTESRFEENRNLSTLPVKNISKVIPTPQSIVTQEGTLSLPRKISINAAASLSDDIAILNKYVTEDLGISLSTSDNDASVNISMGHTGPAESYQLEVSESGINISAADEAGAFYALHSLISMIDPADYRSDASIELAYCKINDAPRFPYRGVHFDVARNFHKKETVLQVLDMMSRYKLNKFHFHITDDEGWRLEIPGLPELTEVGSKRGHTTDELNNLVPHYGSGPDVNGSVGTGYYSRADFIEIIQFARDRHIEVIPEIDIPSHARAAIKSMNARYQKYMDNGNEEEANKYLLHDFDDTSEYSSAQNFSDNIVCVCQESTYEFVDKVITEVVAIFDEAEVPLNTIHSGGDELPYGPWQKSPVCEKFIADNPEVSHTDELHAYFMKRFKLIMDGKNLNTAGWEEIVLEHSEEAHEGTVINEDMLGESYIPYVWNAVWGWGREDMAYKLANAGFEIVFCNSATLYMDMAYNKDPNETGLSWSGWTSTKTAYDVIPLDIFANAKYDKNGNPLKQEDIDSKVRLTETGKKNFKGIQGQIWCETITSHEKLEYMIFPKMIAVAERAWAPTPAWSDGNSELQQRDWNQFTNSLGQRELKKLDHIYGDGIGYRIPLPGAKIIEGKLHANTTFPGLDIRYTEDGTEPNAKSKLYTVPIETKSKEIKLKSFASNGRSSRISSLIN